MTDDLKTGISALKLDVLTRWPWYYTFKDSQEARPTYVEEESYPRRKYESFACSPLSGPLDALPLELLHAVLMFLDIPSLMNVARTNSYLETVVESLPAWRSVATHAPRILRTLNAVEIGSRPSIEKIYHTLIVDQCTSCSRFGPFLSLPSFARYCFDCLYMGRAPAMISQGRAMTWFGISANQIEKIPVQFRLKTKVKSDGAFVSLDLARRLGTNKYRNLVQMRDYVAYAIACGTLENVEAGPEQELNRVKKAIFRICYEFFFSLFSNWQVPDRDARVAAVTRLYSLLDAPTVLFPSLDSRTGTLFYGRCCSGCLALQIYRDGEILEHFKHCDTAKVLWYRTLKDMVDIHRKRKESLNL